MKISKKEFEEYLGKRVRIKLYDNDVIEGELHKTGEERFKDDLNYYIPKGYYVLLYLNSCLFKFSHVKSIKEC